MDTSDSIYRQFVQFEERAAAIYLQLASRFSQHPQLSSLWLDLALFEKQHAGLLQFCLCEKLTGDLPDAAKTQELANFFERLERTAADPNLSTEAASALAIELEASELNDIWCKLTSAVHTSRYLLRRKIATAVPDHINVLIKAARDYGISEEALRRLKEVSETCSADGNRLDRY